MTMPDKSDPDKIDRCVLMQEQLPDIAFYTWNNCPENYKAMAPFPVHFFDISQVTLVAVIRKPKDNIISYIVSRLSPYTDSIETKEITVLYWTVESKVISGLDPGGTCRRKR